MTEPGSATRRQRSLMLPFLMILIALPTLVGLGIWQWQRLGEKQALIARIEARTALPPQELSLKELIASGLSAEQLDYTPVTLRGRFLNADEAQIFTNRPDAAAGEIGGVGYDVMTPFAAEGGGVILVDRGFVPDDRRDPATRAQGQIAAPLSITGLVRRPERRSYLDAADDPQKAYFAVRDPAAILAARLNGLERSALGPIAEGYYVDLRAPVPPGGLPQPNRTSIDIPNNHLQYALTWWGLALVFAAMFGLFLRSRNKMA